MKYKYNISGIFKFDGEEFRDAKFESLENFLNEVMDIKVLDKNTLLKNMEELDCSKEDWFENEKELQMFDEEEIILFTGLNDKYMKIDKNVENTILNYIKESEEFKKTFKELSINDERII